MVGEVGPGPSDGTEVNATTVPLMVLFEYVACQTRESAISFSLIY